ncbi:hypothetical protein ONZ45_g13081 [Pleurotus djamor]|nr:hypothetical protein ONZ45_g13081 [Pleurotus djamor]
MPRRSFQFSLFSNERVGWGMDVQFVSTIQIRHHQTQPNQSSTTSRHLTLSNVPPQALEDEDTVDGRVDVDINEGREVEARIPPKVLERWIHHSAGYEPPQLVHSNVLQECLSFLLSGLQAPSGDAIEASRLSSSLSAPKWSDVEHDCPTGGCIPVPTPADREDFYSANPSSSLSLSIAPIGTTFPVGFTAGGLIQPPSYHLVYNFAGRDSFERSTFAVPVQPIQFVSSLQEHTHMLYDYHNSGDEGKTKGGDIHVESTHVVAPCPSTLKTGASLLKAIGLQGIEFPINPLDLMFATTLTLPGTREQLMFCFNAYEESSLGPDFDDVADMILGDAFLKNAYVALILSDLVLKFGPVIVGLLAANVFLLIVVCLIAVYMRVTRSGKPPSTQTLPTTYQPLHLGGASEKQLEPPVHG